jgi:hypothetical protein
VAVGQDDVDGQRDQQRLDHHGGAADQRRSALPADPVVREPQHTCADDQQTHPAAAPAGAQQSPRAREPGAGGEVGGQPAAGRPGIGGPPRHCRPDHQHRADDDRQQHGGDEGSPDRRSPAQPRESPHFRSMAPRAPGRPAHRPSPIWLPRGLWPATVQSAGKVRAAPMPTRPARPYRRGRVQPGRGEPNAANRFYRFYRNRGRGGRGHAVGLHRERHRGSRQGRRLRSAGVAPDGHRRSAGSPGRAHGEVFRPAGPGAVQRHDPDRRAMERRTDRGRRRAGHHPAGAVRGPGPGLDRHPRLRHAGRHRPAGAAGAVPDRPQPAAGGGRAQSAGRRDAGRADRNRRGRARPVPGPVPPSGGLPQTVPHARGLHRGEDPGADVERLRRADARAGRPAGAPERHGVPGGSQRRIHFRGGGLDRARAPR